MQIRIFGPTVAGFGLIGALIAGLVAFRIPSQYASSTVVHFQQAKQPPEVKKLFHDSFSQSALEALIANEKLYDYQRGRDVRSIKNLVHRLRQAISVQILYATANSRANMLTITFADRDPVKAKRIAEALLGLVIETGGSTVNAPVPPNLDMSPVWPNRPLIAALGCAAGMLAGAIVARRRAARSKTV